MNQLNNQYSSYQWSDGSNSWWISVNNSGTYYVTITDNNGCTGVDSIAVTVIPTITATGDPICNSEPMILDAGPNDASYLWSTGQTSETITPDSTDTYYVTVTGESGCTATADYWINVTQENPTIAATPILWYGGFNPYPQEPTHFTVMHKHSLRPVMCEST